MQIAKQNRINTIIASGNIRIPAPIKNKVFDAGVLSFLYNTRSPAIINISMSKNIINNTTVVIYFILPFLFFLLNKISHPDFIPDEI